MMEDKIDIQDSNNVLAKIDIGSRKFFLYLKDIFGQKVGSIEYNTAKFKFEIGEVFDIYIVDDRLGYCIVDNKLCIANLGISGQKYITQIDLINISSRPNKYISIAHKSDNIYDIKINNPKTHKNEILAFDYQDGKFVANTFVNLQYHVAKSVIINNRNKDNKLNPTEVDIQNIFFADIEWIKLNGFFEVNSCFARTMIMLDYCKQNNLTGNLVVDLSNGYDAEGNLNYKKIGFGLHIDGVGFVRYIGDGDTGNYIFDKSYIYDNHVKLNQGLRKVPFGNIKDKDNIKNIVSMATR